MRTQCSALIWVSGFLCDAECTNGFPVNAACCSLPNGEFVKGNPVCCSEGLCEILYPETGEPLKE